MFAGGHARAADSDRPTVVDFFDLLKDFQNQWVAISDDMG
jgi:hypothetical protein